MAIQIFSALLILATMWAALQLEGVPVESCAGDGTDDAAGKRIRCGPVPSSALIAQSARG